MFAKKLALFQLKVTILGDRDMANGFMTDWVTQWPLWPSKIPRLKVMSRYTGFLSLKVNVLSIQSVLLSRYAALLEYQ